jgi:hypothetical protein
MVPLRAASRLNGAAAPRLNCGGSTRENAETRRRLERRPLRLLRVGERPAGAESGEGRAMDVLSLVTGDLAWRMVRDRGVASGREMGSADLAVLRT